MAGVLLWLKHWKKGPAVVPVAAITAVPHQAFCLAGRWSGLRGESLVTLGAAPLRSPVPRAGTNTMKTSRHITAALLPVPSPARPPARSPSCPPRPLFSAYQPAPRRGH